MGMPLRVVIVEDSEDDAALIIRMLQKGGFDPVSQRVETKDSLDEALDHGDWDLVISDYSMPEFSAQAALHAIGQRKLDIPFLVVSGAVGEDAAAAIMKAGAHDFLRKDNMTRLIAAIQRELREVSERRKRREAEQQIRRYEGELRALASQFSIAEERQRRLLAMDLHDGIGQYLVLIQIKLGEIRRLAEDSDLAAPIENIRKLLDVAIRDTRDLTSQLSPPILYELGLQEALKWLCEQVRKQHGLTSRFHAASNLEDPKLDVKIVVFQSVRELIRNIVKHAGAKCFQLSMHVENGRLLITVADNGVGFDQQLIGARLHKDGVYGLFSIRERLKFLGGDVLLESQPGEGTRVTMAVPLGDAPK